MLSVEFLFIFFDYGHMGIFNHSTDRTEERPLSNWNGAM